MKFIELKENISSLYIISEKLPELEENIANMKLQQEEEIKTLKEEYELRI